MSLGVVQTAYANGSSTRYLEEVMKVLNTFQFLVASSSLPKVRYFCEENNALIKINRLKCMELSCCLPKGRK